MLDQPQLLGEPRLGLGAQRRVRRVALVQPRPAQLGQRPGRGRAAGAAEVGERVPEVARQVERAAARRDLERDGDRGGTVAEQRGGVLRRPQRELAVGPPLRVGAVERAAVADRDEHVVQPVALAPVVVHVGRRHRVEPGVVREIAQRAGQGAVAANVIALQLDEEPVPPEHRAAALGQPARGRLPRSAQDRRQQTRAAPRQDDQPLVPCFERGEIEPRVAAVFPAEMRLREQAAQVRIAPRRLGEQGDVRPVEQRDLGAGDRLEAVLRRPLRERHRAVQSVVIGERESRIAETRCLEHQVLGQRRAIEEGEGGVAVELDIHQGVCANHSPVTRSSNSTMRPPCSRIAST